MSGLLGYLVLFVLVGVGFVFVHLMIGKMIRPVKPDADKLTIYECGEPTIGSAWIQFDLRYYVVALLFVIFDVEVAFFFPWAVVFGQANAVAKYPPGTNNPALDQARTELLLVNPNGAERLTMGGAASPVPGAPAAPRGQAGMSGAALPANQMVDATAYRQQEA